MKRILTASLCSLFLAACSGGGGVTPQTTTPSPTQQMATAQVSIAIPTTTTAGNRRVPKYVSPSTAGAKITVGSNTTNVDLSPTSSACITTTNGRTCTTSITAPTGSVTFTLTTYDVVPSNPNFGTAAHALGTAMVTVTINSGNNTVNVALGGIPATLQVSSAKATMYGGGPATSTIGVTARDVDGNIIIAGTTTVTNGSNSQTDTYANPITVSVTEANPSGAGNSLLLLNGGSPSSSVNVTKSTDNVVLNYDGGQANTAYQVTVTATATNPLGGSPLNASTLLHFLFFGTATGTFEDTPNYGSTSLMRTASPSVGLGVSNETVSIPLVETGAANGTFSAVITNQNTTQCPHNSVSIDNSALVSGGSGSAFKLTGGTVATTGSGCTVHISDGVTASVNLSVTNAANPILFVPDQGTADIDLYDSVTYNSLGPFNAQTGSAAAGSGFIPLAAALDSSGKLFVAYQKPAAGTAPNQGLIQAYDTTVSASPYNELTGYEFTFSGTRLGGIAVNTVSPGNDNLYVTEQDSVPRGYTNCSATTNISCPFTTPFNGLIYGVWIDNTNLKYYIAGDTSSGQDYVDVYRLSNNTQITAETIAQPSTSNRSLGVAVDPANFNVYVSDVGTGEVKVFRSQTLTATIARPAAAATAFGLAYKPSNVASGNRLYVCYDDAIRVYDTGNSNALLKTISASGVHAYGMTIQPGQ